jgi:hypothetical protein
MKYCIFTYDLIPAGVVIWNESQKYYELKLLNEEKLKEKIGKYYCFIDLIQSKIKNWIKTGRLPGPPPKEYKPWQDECWTHVKELLVHNTKLSEIKETNINNIDKLFSEIIKYDN